MDDPKAFAVVVGEAVRRARQAHGWTQAHLAETAGFSPNYIARREPAVRGARHRRGRADAAGGWCFTYDTTARRRVGRSPVKSPPRDCPCFSGLRYATCCGPLHRGECEAASPEALMRSRYAAFALGLGPYLVQTLAEDHPDRALDEAQLVRALSSARERQRFLGLRVDETRVEGDHGEVLFFARIFERGQDRSFAERSAFRREHGHWRYAGGEIVGA
jgi:SEC-C motif domain protein